MGQLMKQSTYYWGPQSQGVNLVDPLTGPRQWGALLQGGLHSLGLQECLGHERVDEKREGQSVPENRLFARGKVSEKRRGEKHGISVPSSGQLGAHVPDSSH